MGVCDPGNRVDASGLAFKGSMLQVQLYTNHFSGEFGAAIAASGLNEELTVEWVSPVEDDGYREYQDESFLKQLGLGVHSEDLARFWPRGGPCWDALGIWHHESASGPVLVEAKSYPKEAFSTLAARSARSLGSIGSALERTASWLGVASLPSSWTEGRYQAANRLAHLFFLREVCGVEARLLFVCVVNDPTHIQTSESAWVFANERLWFDLELDGPPAHTSVIFVPGRLRPIGRI